MQQTIAPPQYLVGIDLALRADHVAVLLDEHARPVGKPVSFGRTHDDFQTMFQTITQRVPEGFGLVWGCEATGAAWRPVTACLLRGGQSVSLENPAAIAALRNVHSRFFKDDRVDARTIAEMLSLRVSRDKPLRTPPSAGAQARRTLARRIEGMNQTLGSAKTRFTSLLCDTALPSLKPSDHEWTGPALLRVMGKFADVRDIARKSLAAFVKSAKKLGGPRTSEAALAKLHEAAVQSVRCYGEAGLDYATHALVLRDSILEITQLQDRIEAMEQHLKEALDQTRTEAEVQCGLSVPGVGEATLDIAMALCGPAGQWASFRAIKQFAGTVPVVDRSGQSARAPRMSKLGEPILRKVIYQIGNVARRYDAGFAANYHDQMVAKGKGHVAASISTGLKVLNCLRAVLRDRRAYEPRDPRSGLPITKKQSRELAQTLYRVPEGTRAARRKHSKGDPANPDNCRLTQEGTTPAGHTRAKDMPKHSHKRAANLR